MTAEQLIKFLANVPKHAILVVPAADHSYRRVTPVLVEAEQYPDGDLAEFDSHAGVEPGSRVVRVLSFV